MDEDLIEQIRKNFEGKTTEELTKIYSEHNEGERSDEAFQVIGQILIERGENIPTVWLSRKSKEEELFKIIKTFPNNKIGLPKLWVGYLFTALLFFFSSLSIPVIDNIDKTVISYPLQIVIVVIFIIFLVSTPLYWLFCVERIHIILGKLCANSYPITPWRAVLYCFIPIYNIYWMFKWPKEVAIYVNSEWADLAPQIGTYAFEKKIRSGNTLGVVFLFGCFINSFMIPNITLSWSEKIGYLIIFQLIIYVPLNSIVSGVKEAFVIHEWKKGAYLKT